MSPPTNSTVLTGKPFSLDTLSEYCSADGNQSRCGASIVIVILIIFLLLFFLGCAYMVYDTVSGNHHYHRKAEQRADEEAARREARAHEKRRLELYWWSASAFQGAGAAAKAKREAKKIAGKKMNVPTPWGLSPDSTAATVASDGYRMDELMVGGRGKALAEVLRPPQGHRQGAHATVPEVPRNVYRSRRV